MMFMQKFEFDSPKLMVFVLGGQTESSNVEIHDVVFVVAQNDEEAIEKIRKKWFGSPKSLHVDSWVIVDSIEDYRVSLSKVKPSDNQNKLYFVNLGYYFEGLMGEHHFMTIVVASSKRKASQKAIEQCPENVTSLHVDDVHDLEGCICIDEVDQFHIGLEYSGIKKSLKFNNGFQKLRDYANPL